MNYVDICPPAVVYRIQEADLQSAESSNLITWVEENSDRECAMAALESVATRLTATSDLSVIDLFYNAVASYARVLNAGQKQIIRAAYQRIPYEPAISFNYFLGLRNARIDLREDLRGKVGIDWSFASPRRDAETWDYYLYLAAMDEPGALLALAAKVADTKSGNDVTLLLISLADLPGNGVDGILKSYANDLRTAEGVNGPGMPIAENVRILLMMREAD